MTSPEKLATPETTPASVDSKPHEILTNALKKIARWEGEFPATGLKWDDKTPMSYGAAYGSNGERDFMRQVALDALNSFRAEVEALATQRQGVAVAQPDAEEYETLRQIQFYARRCCVPAGHAGETLFALLVKLDEIDKAKLAATTSKD